MYNITWFSKNHYTGRNKSYFLTHAMEELSTKIIFILRGGTENSKTLINEIHFTYNIFSRQSKVLIV